MKPTQTKKSIPALIKDGFFSGVGWAFGVTIGFAIVSTLVVYLLQIAGGVPFVGKFFAQIVDSTIVQLDTKNPAQQTTVPKR